MTRYLVQRVLAMISVLILISFITFGVVQLLPGDVALAVLGENLARDEERYQAMREEMGLNRPVMYRYIAWVGDILSGDFGTSLRTGEPVGAALARRLVPTLQLTMMALALAVLIGLPTGILSAVRRNSFLDTIGTMFALFGVAMPNFWLGILLIFLFSLVLPWLPPSGYVPFFENPVESLRTMILPSIALATALAAVIQRQTRSAVLEILQEDYIRTAYSKGLDQRRVLYRHALKNALMPVITVVGMQIGRLFGGAVTLEMVFSIPGMGRLAVDSIYFRDFMTLQGIMLVMAVAVLSVSLLTDIVYTFLDPRIRYG